MNCGGATSHTVNLSTLRTDQVRKILIKDVEIAKKALASRNNERADEKKFNNLKKQIESFHSKIDKLYLKLSISHTESECVNLSKLLTSLVRLLDLYPLKFSIDSEAPNLDNVISSVQNFNDYYENTDSDDIENFFLNWTRTTTSMKELFDKMRKCIDRI